MFFLHGPLLYIIIFFAKLLEVSIATVRNVLINRGQKRLGACLAFVEVVIWLYVVSAVLDSVTEDLMKVLAYSLAFALGNYLGVVIEEKLAIGMSVIEVFALNENSEKLVNALRDGGFGVTTIDSQGKDNKVTIIKVYLKRKQVSSATGIIKSISPSSIISVSDVKTVQGGFIKK